MRNPTDVVTHGQSKAWGKLLEYLTIGASLVKLPTDRGRPVAVITAYVRR